MEVVFFFNRILEILVMVLIFGLRLGCWTPQSKFELDFGKVTLADWSNRA